VQSAGPQEVAKDTALLKRMRDGDESAVGQLYDRYSGIVYSVALRVLNDTGAAEDVLQEVFLQLWRNPGVFDSNRGSLGAWLAVIARNRAIDSLRRRRPETEVEKVVLSVDCDLESETARRVSIEKARAALAKVPAEQRKALELAFFQGLTHTEIAAKTGEPLGTIKTRIRAALIALRKAMTEK
jgi:RNA polymerase sigma-70 factor (ECF subfamily)